jgi:hypothetical protein
VTACGMRAAPRDRCPRTRSPGLRDCRVEDLGVGRVPQARVTHVNGVMACLAKVLVSEEAA